MPFFPNCEIEIFEYNEKPEKDEDGEHLFEYVYKGFSKADLQPNKNNNIQLENGKILTDIYKIYIDKSVEITDKAILRVKGKPETYAILGSPQYNDHGLGIGHLKINAQKQRIPTKLPEP